GSGTLNPCEQVGMSALVRTTDSGRTSLHFRYVPILLQKSKVASARILGETFEREAIDDSDNLSRVTEVAYEFCLGRLGPSDLYTKNAPAALRIFDTFGKTTFATISATSRHRHLIDHLVSARGKEREIY